MSLVLCPECGSRISSKALTCPHCGYVSFNALVPISEQEVYEMIPHFKLELVEWSSEYSIIPYEDNKVIYKYLGDWNVIKNTIPSLAKIIKEIAQDEKRLVADLTPYVKEMIAKGKYKFTLDKDGKPLAILRGSKGFAEQIRLKEEILPKDLTQSINNLQMQMAIGQVIKEVEYIGHAISEIHMELHNDRLSLAESAKDRLLQARLIHNSKLREIAILNVIATATDAKRSLMRNFTHNLNYLDDKVNNKKVFQVATKLPKEINRRAEDSLSALKLITDSVQIESIGYSMLGEFDASKETLIQFKEFIMSNKLNERDTLLLINECLENKQTGDIDYYLEVTKKICDIQVLNRLNGSTTKEISEEESNENETKEECE